MNLHYLNILVILNLVLRNNLLILMKKNNVKLLGNNSNNKLRIRIKFQHYNY